MAEMATIFIPFIFAFAIVYGALDVSGVFKNRRVNGVLALALAFFAISSQDIVNIIYAYLPYTTILFILVFFVSFILSPFKKEGREKDFTLIIMIIALGFVFMMNIGYQAILDAFPSYTIDLQNFTYGGILLGIIILLYAAYQKGPQ